MVARWPLVLVALAGVAQPPPKPTVSQNTAPVATHAPRTIPYHDREVVTLRAKVRFTTTIVLPAGEEILEATRHWSRVEGIFAAPEGAACLVAYRKLRAGGFFKPEDTVVLFNTGSGLKYLDVLGTRVGVGDSLAKPVAAAQPAARQIGGIIGPY